MHCIATVQMDITREVSDITKVEQVAPGDIQKNFI